MYCLGVYTEYTAVLIYGMHRLGVAANSMLLAARLLVYRQLDRGSSMQQNDNSANDLPSLPDSSYSQQLPSISTRISIAIASQQF